MSKSDTEIITILQSLIKTFGSDWCNKRKVSAYLSDYMASDPRQRVLSGIMSSSDAYKVLVSGDNSRLPFWEKYCTDELFLDSSIVEWSINIWCQSCNISIPNNTFKPQAGTGSDNRQAAYNSSSSNKTPSTASHNYVSGKVKCNTDWSFNSKEAKRRQQETAKSLGIQVEKKVSINGVGMEFMLIPAGEFMMGSNNGDSREKPVHKVRITKPFYMGKYEVTNEQYRALISSHDSRDYMGNTLNNNNQPAVKLSWNAINNDYLPKFNSKLSGGYKARFPTEAEWEYACRAGTDSEYYWGNEFNNNMCNSGYNKEYPVTSPVGSFKSNAWGLYDMIGNACEWCEDWYDEEAYSKLGEDDPLMGVSSSHRVLRGGSWYFRPMYCRSADRGGLAPVIWLYSRGVRLILDLPSAL